MTRYALLVTICLAVPAAAAAQVGATAPVVASVVNFERLGTESKTGKATFGPLLALRDKRSAELEAVARPLQDPKVSERERERARVQAQRFAEDAEREMATLQQTLEAEFAAKVRAAVAQVLTVRGPAIVLAVPQPQIVFFSPEADITDAVIKHLDSAAVKP